MSTTKGSVFILLLFALGLSIPFSFLGGLQVNDKKVQKLELQYKTVDTQLKHLELVASLATASSERVILSDKQVQSIVSILIPKKEDQQQFLKILACENKSHDPKRIHTNNPGLGYDLGLAQINSKSHSDRVKQLFGEEFKDAMSDPVRNLVYAAYIYQTSGFYPWVCNKLVN